MSSKTDLSNCPLRIQLILSVLSGKPLKLKNIRQDEVEPGLKGSFVKIKQKNPL